MTSLLNALFPCFQKIPTENAQWVTLWLSWIIVRQHCVRYCWQLNGHSTRDGETVLPTASTVHEQTYLWAFKYSLVIFTHIESFIVKNISYRLHKDIYNIRLARIFSSPGPLVSFMSTKYTIANGKDIHNTINLSSNSSEKTYRPILLFSITTVEE